MKRTKKSNKEKKYPIYRKEPFPRDHFHILCMDPSMRAFGYSVITPYGRIVKTGCIQTAPSKKVKNIRKSDDRIRRISEINKHLLWVIDKWDIEYMISESPHGSQSAIAATMLGICVGIVQTLSDSKDIPIEWYSEDEVKSFIFGKRKIAKSEMITYASNHFSYEKEGVKYIDEAVADSIGVFTCAIEKSNTLRMIKKTL